MQLGIFLVLLVAALVGTGIALRLATTVTTDSGVAYAVGLSAATTVLWLLVTVSAFNITTASGGTEFQHSYPSLAVIGVLGVGVSIVVLGKGSIELLDS